MAVYNAERFLEDSIRSVVAQSFRDWELMIVDDGSTDSTGAIADRWALTDPRIKVLHQPNSGLPAVARNRGMRETSAPIITFLDGDDLFHPDRILHQMQVLDSCPTVEGVFHDFRWFRDGGNPEEGKAYLEGIGFIRRAEPFLTKQMVDGETVWVGSADFIKFMSSETVGIHTSTIAFRRPLLERMTPKGFREDLPHCEDIDMWVRLGRAGRLAVIPRILSYYRYHAAGWMATKDRAMRQGGSFTVKRDMLEKLEAMLTPAELTQYREKIASRWNGVAYSCLVAGLVPQARHAYRNALRLGRSRRSTVFALKGLLVSSLPLSVRRAWWRRTGGGEFSEGVAPA